MRLNIKSFLLGTMIPLIIFAYLLATYKIVTYSEVVLAYRSGEDSCRETSE